MKMSRVILLMMFLVRTQQNTRHVVSDGNGEIDNIRDESIHLDINIETADSNREWQMIVFPEVLLDPEENSSFVQVENPVSKQIEDLSFCLWLKSHFQKSETIIDFSKSRTDGIRLIIQDKKGFVRIKSHDFLFPLSVQKRPRVWTHYCAVYYSSNHTVMVYQNGEKLMQKQDSLNLAKFKFSQNLMQDMFLGKANRGSAILKSLITDLNFWSVPLSRDDILRSANCLLTSHPPDLLHWDSTRWRLEERATVEHLDKTPCVRSQVELTMAARLYQHEAVKLCSILGGSMPSPKQPEDLDNLKRTAESINETNCNHKYWVPITRDHSADVWRSLDSSPVDYLPWRFGQPNGGENQRCAELNLSNHQFGYNDVDCDKAKRCFFCKFSQNIHYRLRGLCHHNVDSEYNMLPGDLVTLGHPQWQGFTNNKIIWDPAGRQWVIVEAGSEEPLAKYQPHHPLRKTHSYDGPYDFTFPVGLHHWQIVNDTCRHRHGAKDKSGKSSLLLTKCDENEFTCEDGSCIPFKRKCDGVIDCPKQRDENNCGKLSNLSHHFAHYQKSIPPIKRRQDSEDLVALEVMVSLVLIEVTDIVEINMKLSAKFELCLTWIESRVKWKDLGGKVALNVLNQEDTAKLWIPTVIFSNTANNDRILLDSHANVYVEKRGNFKRSPLENVQENMYYEGKENPIHYKREYQKQFSCDFDFSYFPFDTQVCFIDLRTTESMRELVKLVPNQVRYDGKLRLMQYKVMVEELEWVHCDVFVRVKLVLQRVFFYHLATTYLPTLCILLVGQGTLYFKSSEHFKTSVPVSVAAMLVTYTHYQAVALSLPPTSYIKMIDVWLLFGLILPFFIFCILVVVEHPPDCHKIAIRSFFVFTGHKVFPLIILLFIVIYWITASVMYSTQHSQDYNLSCNV